MKRKHRMPEPPPEKPTWDERLAFYEDIEEITASEMPEVALGHIFSCGVRMIEALMETAISGKGGFGLEDTIISFPDELAIEYGGPEERFGYIEMGNLSFGNVEGVANVPLPQVMEYLEVLAKHYVKYRPDKCNRVGDLMDKARDNIARMQNEHEAWKRQHGSE